MRTTEEQLKNQIHEVLNQLRTLRDEVRVDLHLAGMEAKQRWADLEPKFHEVEQLGREVSETSKQAIADALQKLRDFRETMRA